MNRLGRKVRNLIEANADLDELKKEYPKTFNKVMRWLMYKKFRGQEPRPWRPL